MSSTETHYTALGLEPGADASAIERAYKRLIKRYHPDRPGGDADKAAEINQAYDQLRKTNEQPFKAEKAADVGHAIYARRMTRNAQILRRRRSPNWWPALIVGLCGLAWLQRAPLQRLATDLSDRLADMSAPSRQMDKASAIPVGLPELSSPLEADAIAQAVDAAVALTKGGNGEAAIEHSRDCHRAFRTEPTLARLDRCAAFDDAVLEIENPDPMIEQGGFAASAVTARQNGRGEASFG
jgi:hypothetical protein